MQITKEQLKRIIKEELEMIIQEEEQSAMAEMRITTVSGHFPQGNLPPPEPEVPNEAKEMIFADMVKNNLVPKGGTIEDADFWEVKPGDYGYEDAVEINGKRYYGEI